MIEHTPIQPANQFCKECGEPLFMKHTECVPVVGKRVKAQTWHEITGEKGRVYYGRVVYVGRPEGYSVDVVRLTTAQYGTVELVLYQTSLVIEEQGKP